MENVENFEFMNALTTMFQKTFKISRETLKAPKCEIPDEKQAKKISDLQENFEKAYDLYEKALSSLQKENRDPDDSQLEKEFEKQRKNLESVVFSILGEFKRYGDFSSYRDIVKNLYSTFAPED